MSFFLRAIAPRILTSITWRTAEPAVHITFDDGPHPEATPKVLDILRQRHQRAAFFLLGLNAQRYPHLVRQIKDDGHLIGNHSMTHISLFLKPTTWQKEQLNQAGMAIEGLVQERPILFRPPFGHFNIGTMKVVRELNLRMVLWSVDPKDFSSRDPRSIAHRACADTRLGSILLLHDNDATVTMIGEYLNRILDDFERRHILVSPLPL